jgi:hypothetical protein
MMKVLRRGVAKRPAVAAVVLAPFALMLAFGPAAYAGQTAHFTRNNVPIFASPSSGGPAISYGCANTSCTYYYLTGGHSYCLRGTVTGASGQQFQWVHDLANGVVGYVILYNPPSVATNNPSSSCS